LSTDTNQSSTSIDRVAMLKARHAHNVEQWQDWRDRAIECRNMYSNKQWDQRVKALLERSGRMAWTFNMLRPMVDTVSGYQRQNRRDLKCVSRKGGHDTAAMAYTALLRHTMDMSNGNAQMSEAFSDGLRTGKGWVHLDFDTSADPYSGDVKIEQMRPLGVVEDADCEKYDLSDAHSVEFGRWRDQEWAAEQWKKYHREKIDTATKTDGMGGGMSAQQVADWMVDASSAADLLTDDRNRGKFRVWVVTTYWKQPARRVCFIDQDSYRQVKFDPGKPAEVQQAAAWLEQNVGELLATLPPEAVGKVIPAMKALYAMYPDRFGFADQLSARVNRTMRIGDTEIEHVDDYMRGLDFIPMYRFCPYWDDGYVFGMLDGMKDPQQFVNKMYSQVVNLLNQTTNAGWKTDKKLTPAALRDLELFGSTPGIVIQTPVHGNAERLVPNQPSTGHLALADRGPDVMKAVSGVSNALLGGESEQKESGRLNEMRRQQGLTVLEPVFDNFDITTQVMAESMVEILRVFKVYPPREIVQVVAKADLIDPALVEEARAEIMPQVEAMLGEAGRSVPQQPSMADTAMMLPEHQQTAMAVGQEQMDAFNAAVEPLVFDRAVEMLIEDMQSWTFGRYSVEVTNSPHSPTQKMMTFEELKDMAAMGVPIPPQVIVKASSLPKTLQDEIIEEMSKMQAPPAQGATK